MVGTVMSPDQIVVLVLLGDGMYIVIVHDSCVALDRWAAEWPNGLLLHAMYVGLLISDIYLAWRDSSSVMQIDHE